RWPSTLASIRARPLATSPLPLLRHLITAPFGLGQECFGFQGPFHNACCTCATVEIDKMRRFRTQRLVGLRVRSPRCRGRPASATRWLPLGAGRRLMDRCQSPSTTAVRFGQAEASSLQSILYKAYFWIGWVNHLGASFICSLRLLTKGLPEV